jgi:hypothetical protein
MSLSVQTIFAQRTPCDSPHPTPQVLATVQQNIASVPVPSAPFTWEIPVRVTVFLKDDGSGQSSAVSETQIDNFLSNMNGELVGGLHTYHFYRCGPINFIHVSELEAGNFSVTDYSYAANFMNLYLYDDNVPPNTASAQFPWDYPIRNAVYLTDGQTIFHQELVSMNLAIPWACCILLALRLHTSSRQHLPNRIGLITQLGQGN